MNDQMDGRMDDETDEWNDASWHPLLYVIIIIFWCPIWPYGFMDTISNLTHTTIGLQFRVLLVGGFYNMELLHSGLVNDSYIWSMENGIEATPMYTKNFTLMIVIR